ncbi:MAG: LysR family transcriptional regulator [Proteobacteria bacterium]|nr:LysR family transcriptional regulator [Pseudomonadota bacterium]
MEIASLQLFVTVAASGSFSRAATLVGSTQSAVSKRIAELERECGWRLFARTGRGVELTDAGRWLLPRASVLASQVDGLADQLASTFATPRGVVRLALQPSIAWPLVGRLVARARQVLPAVRLQILEGPTGDVATWLREGRADLAVLNARDSRDDATPLFTTTFHLIAAAGDRLTRAATVRFGALRGLPLVAAVSPNGGRILLEEAAQRAGFGLELVAEVNSVNMLKRLVGAGVGYSIASRESVADELAAHVLQASRIVAPSLHEHFALRESTRRPSSPAVRRVAELVVGLCRESARRHSPRAGDTQ